MKTILAAAAFALFATSVFAGPAGWDRPGGYYSQANSGKSL